MLKVHHLHVLAAAWCLECEGFELLPDSWSRAKTCRWTPALILASQRSPRTNTEGGWSHSCVRKGARTPLIFFFNLPLPWHLNSLHYLQHPSSGALWQTRNRYYDSRWSVLPLFFAFFFFGTFEGHSVSLFFWDDTLSPLSSCHLPPERQPTSADHTADPGRCPRVDTGAGGGTRVGWQNRQREKEPLTEMSGRRGVKRKTKAVGLGGHYLWSDAGISVLMSSAGVLTSTKDISQMLQNIQYMQPL